MSALHDSGWQRIDKASFGLIYGAIMVLSILLAAGAHPEAPYRMAAILFGSVLAITLAKTFADLISHALDSGDRITFAAWGASWHHSYPTLAVANLPTLFFIAAGLGWMTTETALFLSQGLCVALLATLGGRVGWVIDARIFPAILGALLSGGFGLALAVLKVLIH